MYIVVLHNAFAGVTQFREDSCASLVLLGCNALRACCSESGTLYRNDSGWGSQGRGFRGGDDIIHRLQVDV